MDLLVTRIATALASRLATCLGGAILLWSGLFDTVGGTSWSTLGWCSGRRDRLSSDTKVSRSAGGFGSGSNFH